MDPQLLRSKLRGGSLWAFVGKVLMLTSALLANALLARLLNPDELGTFFLTFSLVSFCAIIAQLGLPQVIIGIVAHHMATGREQGVGVVIYRGFLGVAAGGSIVGAVLLLGGGEYLSTAVFKSPLMVGVIGLAAIWALFLAVQGYISEAFRGFHDIKNATLFSGLLASLLSLSCYLFLWIFWDGTTLRGLIRLTVVSLFVSVLIGCVVLAARVRSNFVATHIRPVSGSGSGFGLLYRAAWPLWLTGMTLFIVNQVDLWMVGWFLTPQDVALYGAAVRLALLIVAPLVVVNSVVPPIIAELYATGELATLERSLRTTTTLAAIPSVAIFALYLLFGDVLLSSIFGSYYVASIPLLLILGIGQLANVLLGSCGLTLIHTGNQKSLLGITLLCSVLTVISAILLTKSFGTVGIAWAAAGGLSLQNILMWWYVKRTIGIFTHFSPIFLLSFMKDNFRLVRGDIK